METDKKYHYLRNGKKVTLTLEEAQIINESGAGDSLKYDVQWYLAHGYVTAEEFEKRHQYNEDK